MCIQCTPVFAFNRRFVNQTNWIIPGIIIPGMIAGMILFPPHVFECLESFIGSSGVRITPNPDPRSEQKDKKCMLKEARILKKLDHPCIVQVTYHTTLSSRSPSGTSSQT